MQHPKTWRKHLNLPKLGPKPSFEQDSVKHLGSVIQAMRTVNPQGRVLVVSPDWFIV